MDYFRNSIHLTLGGIMAFSIVIKDKTFSSLLDMGKEMYLYPEAFEKVLTSRKFLKILKRKMKKNLMNY